MIWRDKQRLFNSYSFNCKWIIAVRFPSNSIQMNHCFSRGLLDCCEYFLVIFWDYLNLEIKCLIFKEKLKNFLEMLQFPDDLNFRHFRYYFIFVFFVFFYIFRENRITRCLIKLLNRHWFSMTLSFLLIWFIFLLCVFINIIFCCICYSLI